MATHVKKHKHVDLTTGTYGSWRRLAGEAMECELTAELMNDWAETIHHSATIQSDAHNEHTS